MTLTVREARDDDWAGIWPIIREVAEDGTTFALERQPDEEASRSWWMRPPHGRVVVAVDGDQVLGTATMYANRPHQGSHVASASFMVSAQARGRGVGRLLVRDLIEWATSQGFVGIQFNAVVATNTSAIRLYEDEGFRVLGAAPGAFRHPVQGDVDLLIMWRDLVPRP